MVRREKLSQWKRKKFPNFYFFSIFELLQYAKLIENHQTQPGKQNKKKWKNEVNKHKQQLI